MEFFIDFYAMETLKKNNIGDGDDRKAKPGFKNLKEIYQRYKVWIISINVAWTSFYGGMTCAVEYYKDFIEPIRNLPARVEKLEKAYLGEFTKYNQSINGMSDWIDGVKDIQDWNIQRTNNSLITIGNLHPSAAISLNTGLSLKPENVDKPTIPKPPVLPKIEENRGVEQNNFLNPLNWF